MKKITTLKQLTSFNAACKVEGLDPKKVVPDFSGFPSEDRNAMVAHAKLVIITKAANRIANGGKPWKANFADHKQWKYTAWYYHPEEGSPGFRFDVDGSWYSCSAVGSRLCFFSGAVAKHVGTTFIGLVNEYFV